MYLTVKNTGKGRSYKTQADIANLSGEASFSAPAASTSRT